ncbi:hypothetical protein Q1695_007290 [Nippostrongylus brasiliensis]|nr:hypothetical protein Q1695_007290 [Nippostrongylus brasiliensis]
MCATTHQAITDAQFEFFCIFVDGSCGRSQGPNCQAKNGMETTVNVKSQKTSLFGEYGTHSWIPLMTLPYNYRDVEKTGPSANPVHMYNDYESENSSTYQHLHLSTLSSVLARRGYERAAQMTPMWMKAPAWLS